MKKFSFWTRSLLLLCFIVFCGSNGWAWSDFALTGDFNEWNPTYLTKVNDNHASVGNSTSATTTLTATAAGKVTANFEQSSTPTPTRSNTDYAYYLIGNFMSTDGENINETDRKFRFFKNPDGTYYFDVPATLKVKSQIVAVEGSTSKIYGPESSTVFNIENNRSETYPLGNNTNYFQANDRGYQSYGMYTYTLTVDPTTGAPLSVKVTHNQLKTVAYFWPEVTATSPNPTVQPCYSSRDNAQSGGDDKYFGSVNLEENQKCFVIGNMCQESNNNNACYGLQYTKTKLYVQGNGGGDVIERKNQPNGVDYTKVYPTWADENRTVNADGFTFGGQAGAYLLEYNPSKGYNNVAAVNEGIGGEVQRGSTSNQNVNITDPITSISVIGEGIPGSSWEIAKKKVMKYNQELQCYEYTFTKTTDESANELFRFIANDSWNINFEENGTADTDKARVPYNVTGAGHSAMESDPNYVKKAGEYNGQRADADTHDIILNRPAGEWTIRFYIVTKPTQGGNDFTSEYYYTITGKENNKVSLTFRHDKFIRTYSNDIPMDLTDGVKAYIAYKFDPAEDNDKYGKCKVYLRQMKYIPANVGVVLVGEVPDGENFTDGQKLEFSLQKRIEAVPENLCEVWVKYGSYAKDAWHNFLVPTVTAVNNLGNAKVNSDGKIIYRYFGLSSYYNTAYYQSTHKGEDYIGFFRLTEQGKSGDNKAYLSIPSSAAVGTVGTDGVTVTEENLKTYGFLDFNAQLSGQETDEGVNTSLAKAMLLFDDENFDNDITAIGIITENDSIVNDNAYYNLQGVRVANPSKGIYIFNGKKILVK